jgi:hypothetical protein
VEAARHRHLAWCVELGEEAAPELTGAQQQVWLERLEAEHDNVRAALLWAGERDAEQGLRLAASVWRFWAGRGYFGEGRGWLEGLLSAARAVTPAVRAKALNGAGVLAYLQGDYVRAKALYEESLVIRRELGDRSGIASSVEALAEGRALPLELAMEFALEPCESLPDGAAASLPRETRRL